MGFNVQPDSARSTGCLLEWSDAQRRHLGYTGRLPSFQKLIEEGWLYRILEQVDAHAFEDFQWRPRESKMDTLEKYLEREFGKRMKLSMKQSFGSFSEAQEMTQFAKLVCFLGVHSHRKAEFIARIFQLPEQTQQYLMNEVQNVEKKLENIVELRQIIEQFETLQYQNDQLKTKLQQMDKTNVELLQILREYEKDASLMKIEINKFRNEKIEVLTALKIQYFGEYLELYNQLRFENEKSLELLRDTEIKLEASENTAIQLNERIKAECIVIADMSEEIKRLRKVCEENQFKGDGSTWLEPTSRYSIRSVNSSSNKENISRSSTSIGKSVDCPVNFCELFSLNETEEQSMMKSCNSDLMSKLEGMYAKFNRANNESSSLREQNKNLEASCHKSKQTLKQVQQLYEEFEVKYKASRDETLRILRQNGLY